MKVKITIDGKDADVKELARELSQVLCDWNRLSKKAGTEKAKFEIAMLSRMFNEQGKAV